MTRMSCLPSRRPWKSGRGKYKPNRSPPNRPPTWYLDNQRVIAQVSAGVVRHPLARAVLAVTACFISVAAAAQTASTEPAVSLPKSSGQAFPTRPVRIIVPYAAGGAVDTVARAVGGKLSDTWKQPVVIDNRPGGAANVGTELAAR